MTDTGKDSEIVLGPGAKDDKLAKKEARVAEKHATSTESEEAK